MTLLEVIMAGVFLLEKISRPIRKLLTRMFTLPRVSQETAEVTLNWILGRERLLSDIAARLLEHDNPQELVEALCRQVVEFLDCDTFFNFLADDQKKCLKLNAFTGISKDEARKIERLDYDLAICGCVARNRQFLVAEDIGNSSDLRTELIKSFGIQAYCCHPLLAQDRLIGTLSFGTRLRPRFSSKEVLVMKDVANLVSIAMNRIDMERAHRDSEQRLRWALKCANGGVWDWDLVSDQAWWSPEMYELWGVEPGTKMGLDNSLSIVCADDRTPLQKVLEKSISNHSDYQCEFRIQHPTRGERWIMSSGRLLYNGDGSPVRLIGLSLDITERKNAERELHENREDLNRAQMVAHTGSWRLDVRKNELLWSDENWRIFGAKKGMPLTYETFLSMVHPEDREYVHQKWSAALRGEPYDVDHRIMIGDTIKWVREKAELEFDANGMLKGGFGTTQDITEKKEGEESLRQAKAAAETANAAKSQFLANMSHEIRTPLGAVMGFSELMARPDISETERKECSEIISRNGAQLLRLIDDILQISSIEAGTVSCNKAPVSTGQLLTDVKTVLGSKARAKRIRFGLEIDGLPEFIFTDYIRLKQILLNLGGNAIKFTPADGKIVLCAGIDSGTREVFFLIKDTGIGIAPEHQSQIFEAFAQADPSIATTFGGTGLGLAISRRLAQSLGGSLVLQESAPGCGSTFMLRIPNEAREEARCDQELREKGGKDESVRVLNDLRVLLVEDAEDNIFFVKRLLGDQGALVDVARNGREGVDKALAGSYNVVLMDMRMPIMDGLAATKELRARGYREPIIALTAYALQEERESSLKAGCNAHLTKPIAIRELTSILKEFLS